MNRKLFNGVLSAFVSLTMIFPSLAIMGTVSADNTSSTTTSIGTYDTTFSEKEDSASYGSYVNSTTYADQLKAARYGDINEDGSVNAVDLLLLRKSVVGTALTGNAATLADFNDDTYINAKDILILRRGLVGLVDLDKEYGIPAFNVDKFAVDGVNISDFDIAVPTWADDTTNVYYSATEMVKYIQYACGVTLSIVTEGSSAKAHQIILDMDPTATIDGTKDQVPGDLGTEGFDISVSGGNVTIHGGTMRGTMYGTYEFLEDYAGYRFMGESMIYVYKSHLVNISDGVDNQQIPAFNDRIARGYGMDTQNEEGALKYGLPRKLNSRTELWGGLYSSKYGYMYGRCFINAHSFGYYKGMAETNDPNKANNDYDQYQPDFSSEEDYQTMFTGMLRTIEMIKTWNPSTYDMDPATSMMSFSISDYVGDASKNGFCECHDCKAVVAAEGGYAALIIKFVNRAADEIQKYYPGLKLFTILYTHEFPKTVRPNDNVVVIYCGTGCSTHSLGSGACGTDVNGYNYCTWTHSSLDCQGNPVGNNNGDEIYIPQWGQACNNFEYWYYAANFIYSLCPLPCTFVMKDDIEYFAKNGAEGVFVEGAESESLNFDSMHYYLAGLLAWNPYMSDEEYQGHISEYLRAEYGDGWKYLYDYIVMMREANLAAGCCVTNHDSPTQMYDMTYMAAHYEEMREKINTAYMLASSDSQRTLVYNLRLALDMLGLTATYASNYTNGTDAQKAEYTSRYTEWFNYLKNNNLIVRDFSDGHSETQDDHYVTLYSDTVDLSVTPVELLYNLANTYHWNSSTASWSK